MCLSLLKVCCLELLEIMITDHKITNNKLILLSIINKIYRKCFAYYFIIVCNDKNKRK